jgi:cellobiose PTS system EIIA component
MENTKIMENIAFQMVAAVNEARGLYLQAIQSARTGAFDKAIQLIEMGDSHYNTGHAAHTQLLQMEAAGEGDVANLLIMHAEDQLMSSENYKVLAVESVHIYKAVFSTKK